MAGYGLYNTIYMKYIRFFSNTRVTCESSHISTPSSLENHLPISHSAPQSRKIQKSGMSARNGAWRLSILSFSCTTDQAAYNKRTNNDKKHNLTRNRIRLQLTTISLHPESGFDNVVFVRGIRGGALSRQKFAISPTSRNVFQRFTGGLGSFK